MKTKLFLISIFITNMCLAQIQVSPTYITPPSTCNSCDGKAKLQVYSSASGQLSLVWSGGTMDADQVSRKNMCWGVYNISITDGAGNSKEVFIKQGCNPANFSAFSFYYENPSACSTYDGRILTYSNYNNYPYTYKWSNGSTSSQLYDLCAGKYNVTITDSKSSTYTTEIRLNEKPAATPTLTISGSTITSTPATSYQWYMNSTEINGATNQSITAITTGTYEVRITDTSSCSAFGSVYWVAPTTGIKELQVSGMISPNPATDHLLIKTGTPQSLIIYSVTGQAVINQVVRDQEVVSLSEFLPGVYLYRLGDNKPQKFIINR